MANKMKKHHVRVKPVKLELPAVTGDCTAEGKVAMVEVKWVGPVSGFVLPFYRSRRVRNRTSQKPIKDCHVAWDDEFEHLCSLLGPWDLSFKVFYGESNETKNKLAVMGKASLDLSDVASMKKSTVERNLPIRLKGPGIAKEATLVVSVSFADARNSTDSVERLLKMTKNFKDSKFQEESARWPANGTLSAGEECRSGGGKLSPTTESSSSSSPETRSDSSRSSGFLSWKRRRLSFSLSRRRESLVSNSDEVAADLDRVKEDHDTKLSAEPNYPDDWVLKELVSRDGKSKLKSKVYFASFDQRSEEAAGESACTAVVVITAHWFHANPNLTPSRLELDSLIRRGSSLWQTLCNDESYVNSFPDKHFDLETVISANLRPIKVCTERSFTGFFSPEKFESLKGLMSFDHMWDEIEKNTGKGDHEELRIYIMSWNDHFFVLKVDADGYYIIDSLGERLFEGCKQAYILKFDDSSLIYEKKVVAKSEETEKTVKDNGDKPGKENAEEPGKENAEEPGKENAEEPEKRESEMNPKTEEEENDEESVICSGKDCCREYMKRFLAGLTVAELEDEEKKGMDVTNSLHKRLQVDLHYTNLSIPVEGQTEILLSSS